jgi:hypothetical protein
VTAYEAISGIAKVDRNYGYIAVRPPLRETQLSIYAKAISPTIMQEGYILRANIDDESTELEFWALGPRTPEEMVTKLAAKLGSLVRLGGNTLVLLPGCIDVDGAQPLFEQYELQQAQL